MELKRMNEKQLAFYGENDKEYEIYLNGTLVSKGIGTLIFDDPDMTKQTIFTLKSGNETEMISERVLPLTGVVNFRDLGGYKTKDNRQVKYQHFYRSAPLAHLTKEQHDYVQNIHLKHNIDFRSASEIVNMEDETFEGCTYHHLSGIKDIEQTFKGNFDFENLMKSGDVNVLGNYLLETYKTLPIDNHAYKEMFKMIEAKGTPLVFHCTAGKDRTGVAGALILLALGVDEKTVMEDYLASNIYRHDENERIFATAKEHRATMEKMMYVYEAYLNNSLNAIKETYGNYETFFEKEFGLTQDKLNELRAYYLY